MISRLPSVFTATAIIAATGGEPSLLRASYRGAEPTRRYPNYAAKDGGQMALVDEASFLRNRSQRLIGVSDQCLRPFEALLEAGPNYTVCPMGLAPE